MQILPNGCRRSEFLVHPKNWKSKDAPISKAWYIMYRFYDPAFTKDGKIIPKQVLLKCGTNWLKTVKERQTAIKALLENEKELLLKGYNPWRKVLNTPVITEIDKNTRLAPALTYAMGKLDVVPKTRTDIKSVIKGVEKSAMALGFDVIPASMITRKHIKMILENCANINKRWSNNRFNMYKAYLSTLFNELIEVEICDINPLRDIKKKDTVRKIRELLTEKERKQIGKLKETHYKYWRFLIIFFHSGCRLTELCRLKASDVNLTEKEFTVTVLKGRNKAESLRVISEEALPLWSEILASCGPSELIFGHLRDGKVNNEFLTDTWRELVKDGMAIKKDLYSLKHLHSDLVAEKLGLEYASIVNGHSTTLRYAVGERRRMLHKVGKCGIRF